MDYRTCATCGADYSARYDACPLCSVQTQGARLDSAVRWRVIGILAGALVWILGGRNLVFALIGAVLILGNGFALAVGLVPYLRAVSERAKLKRSVKRGGRIG